MCKLCSKKPWDVLEERVRLLKIAQELNELSRYYGNLCDGKIAPHTLPEKSPNKLIKTLVEEWL